MFYFQIFGYLSLLQPCSQPFLQVAPAAFSTVWHCQDLSTRCAHSSWAVAVSTSSQQTKLGHIWTYAYKHSHLYLLLYENHAFYIDASYSTLAPKVHSNNPLSIPIPPFSNKKKKTGSHTFNIYTCSISLYVVNLPNLAGHCSTQTPWLHLSLASLGYLLTPQTCLTACWLKKKAGFALKTRIYSTNIFIPILAEP